MVWGERQARNGIAVCKAFFLRGMPVDGGKGVETSFVRFAIGWENREIAAGVAGAATECPQRGERRMGKAHRRVGGGLPPSKKARAQGRLKRRRGADAHDAQRLPESKLIDYAKAPDY